MKITANNHAIFSPQPVLLELIIINIGNSQINTIIPKIIRTLNSETSISYWF